MHRLVFAIAIFGGFAPCLAQRKKPEVLYQRALTPQERGKEIGYMDYPIKDKNSWVERERKRYKLGKQVPKNWIKVELFYRNVQGETWAVERAYSTNPRWVLENKQWKWQKEARPRLTLGKDRDGFKFVESYLKFSSGNRFYYEKIGDLGWAEERFKGPKGQKVIASIYEARKRKLTLHEFLHDVVNIPFQIKHTEIGTVLTSGTRLLKGRTRDRLRGRFRGLLQRARTRRKRREEICAAWISGEHIAVYVGGNDVSVTDLVRLYGKKFPSTLPKDFKVDKTTWGRREVELTLKRVKKFLDTPDERVPSTLQPPDVDGFSWNLYRLEKYVFIPVWPRGVALGFAPQGLRLAIYRTLSHWWQANKDKTYWNEKHDQLMAKGQSPEELQQAARKGQARPKAEWETYLLKSFTDKDAAAAKRKVIAEFEKEYRARASATAKRLEKELGKKEEAKRVAFKKLAEGKWRYDFRFYDGSSADVRKNGVQVRQVVTGPKVERTGNALLPLKAVFHMRTEEPKRFSGKYARTYLYEVLNERWIETAYSWQRIRK